MIASVGWTFQIASAPWPCWKMKTMIPKAAASEIRFRITALTARKTERNARIRRTKVSRITKASTYGNFP